MTPRALKRKKILLAILIFPFGIVLASYLLIRKDLPVARRLIEASSGHTYPSLVQAAFLAAEDPDFFEHSRFYVLQAVWSNLADDVFGRPLDLRKGHASLTTQIVRHVVVRPERSRLRHIKEPLVALYLDLAYDRDSILVAYMDNVYMGRIEDDLLYGVNAAARSYFHKAVVDLNLPESALLAGMVRNPHIFSPVTNPTEARERRNQVLEKMFQAGAVSKGDFVSAKETPILGGVKQAVEADGEPHQNVRGATVPAAVPRGLTANASGRLLCPDIGGNASRAATGQLG